MRKQKNKVITGVLLAVMSTSLLTACGNKTTATQPQTEEKKETTETQETETQKTEAQASETQETESQEEKTQIQETTSTENDVQQSDNEIPDAYAKMLDEYKTMIDEKWDLEKISEENLCPIVAAFYEDNAAEQTGYLLYDLNGDNQPELLVGETDTQEAENRIIFDAYTLKDGVAQQLFVSYERDRYYLIEDEAGARMIANEGSNGAASSGWMYYTLGEDGLQVVQAIIYDAMADEENPWFMAYDDDWDVSNDEGIDEQTAQDIIDANTQNYAKLDWIPLGE